MRNKALKIFLIFSLVMLIGTFGLGVKALDIAPNPENQVKNTVNNFLLYIEYGSSYTFNYIDSNNKELYNKAQNRIHTYDSIDYEITKVKQKGDIYKVDVKINAEGDDFKVNGITANFDVKYVNGAYRIVDTNFFDITSRYPCCKV